MTERTDLAARAEEAALDLARRAMACMAAGRPGPDQRTTKAHAADWVTDVDVAVEREVRDQLSDWFPDHAVAGEELGGDVTGHELRWYVDPVDGTTNFVHGLPGYTFSLAFADGEGLLVGVVANPHGDEVWSAVRGRGARCNGTPVRCSYASSLVGGIVTTELAGVELWPGLVTLMADLSEHRCVTRIMGSSAHSIASVAAGRSLAAVGTGLNPIDVAAGVLIAREGGARVLGGGSSGGVLGCEEPDLTPLLVVVAPGVADALVELLTAS